MPKEKKHKSKSESEYSFEIITRDRFQELGINPAYIPFGSVVSRKNPYDILKKLHPNLDFLLKNKYGRDPWGGGTEFGIAEGITEQEFEIFIHIDDPKISAEEKNEVLRKLLLKIVSSENKIYYIIPGYLASDLTPYTRKIKSILQLIIKKYYNKHIYSQKEIESFVVGTTNKSENLLSQSLYHYFPKINFKNILLTNLQYLAIERYNLIYTTDFFSILTNLISENNIFQDLTDYVIAYYVRYIFKEFYCQLKFKSTLVIFIDKLQFRKQKGSGQSIYNLLFSEKFNDFIKPFYTIIENGNYEDGFYLVCQRIQPKYTVKHIECKLMNLGLTGTTSSLVADYKNSINFIVNVIKVLNELNTKSKPFYLKGLTPIQKDELEIICTDLRESKSRHFEAILSLIKKIDLINHISKIIVPDVQESRRIPFLENIFIYSLFGFTQEELEEMFLIVTGHSTMTGIVRGKLPTKALEPITEKSFIVNKDFSEHQLNLMELIIERKNFLTLIEIELIESLLNNKSNIKITDNNISEILRKITPYLPPLDAMRINEIFMQKRQIFVKEKEILSYIIKINIPLNTKEKKILKKIIEERKIISNAEQGFLNKLNSLYYRLLENHFIYPEKVADIIKRFYLLSIVEAAVGNNGVITPKQFDRFNKVRRETDLVIFNPDKTWNNILEEKITFLGGTFWLSIRRMLRLFNILKVDQTLMKDLESRVDLEIKIMSEYDFQMMIEYKETQKLIKIARAFRDYYYIPIRFDQPFFFRRFLEKYEIHGSGRVFPMLSTESGFKLLWIAVQASHIPCVDFNPLLPSYLERGEEREKQLKEIEKSLTALPIESLNFDFFSQVKNKLLAGEIVSIYASGLELKMSKPDDTLMISYTDVKIYLKDLSGLLSQNENKNFDFKNIEVLRQLEFLHSELIKYLKFYREEIELIQIKNIFSLRNIAELNDLISKVEHLNKRIKSLFIHEIFDPEQVGTKIDIMSSYCPKILEMVLHEFIELKKIREVRREHRESATDYIKRMVHKLQVVATKMRSEFQNRNVFEQLVQIEFGDKTIVNIEVSEKQLDKLEQFYESLRGTPQLIKAMPIAIIFSNIGKLPSMLYKYHNTIDFTSYPESGVKVLELEKILDELMIDQDTRNLSLHLIKHFGQIGDIIRGGFSFTSLQDFFTINDESLQNTINKIGMEKVFTAQMLLGIIIAGSVVEGMLTYDLLEKFFKVYEQGMSIINHKYTIDEIYSNIYKLKGKKVSNLLNKISYEKFPYIKEKNLSISELGEKAYVVERLFSIRGLYGITFENILDFFNLVTNKINFDDNGLPILNKHSQEIIQYILCKDSQCIGNCSFKEQIINAISLYHEFRLLPENIRQFFNKNLSGTSKFKFWYVSRATRKLLPINQLKILYLVLKGMEYRQKIRPDFTSPHISFFGLTKNIDYRQAVLDEYLKSISFRKIGNKHFIEKSFKPYKGGLYIKFNRVSGSLKISFYDITDINKLIKKMILIQNIKKLDNFYYSEIEKFKKSPFNTADYQEKLHEAYVVYKDRLNNQLVKNWQSMMRNISLTNGIDKNEIFQEYIKLYNKIYNIYTQAITEGKKSELSSQGFTILKDTYEINIERLHNELQKKILDIQKEYVNVRELEEFTIKNLHFINKHKALFKEQFAWSIINNYKKISQEYSKS